MAFTRRPNWGELIKPQVGDIYTVKGVQLEVIETGYIPQFRLPCGHTGSREACREHIGANNSDPTYTPDGRTLQEVYEEKLEEIGRGHKQPTEQNALATIGQPNRMH